MNKNTYTFKYRRSVKIDLDSHRIGGGVYAVMKESEKRQELLQGEQIDTSKQSISEQIKQMPHENVMKAVWANLKGEKLTYPGIDNFIGIARMQWVMIDIHYDDYNFTEKEYFEIAKFAMNKWPQEARRVHADKLSAGHFYSVMSIALAVCRDEKKKRYIQKRINEYSKTFRNGQINEANGICQTR